MKNKKIAKIVLLVGLCLVCVVVFSPKALAITASEIQQQITALLAQINQLQQQLAQMQGNQAVAWCHTFNTNLGVGSKGGEVDALQTALQKEGLLTGYDTSMAQGKYGSFDEMLASDVVALQEKYASEILKPYGLKRGTGYVGKSTRAKLNKLYGCPKSSDGSLRPACPTDAKQCPDGSYVGRTGANCEFAQCPLSTTTSSPVTACVKEGELGQPTAALAKDCCSGLKTANPTNVYDATCNLTPDAQIAHRLDYTCIYCGNGVCGLGENKCNCPSDCK